MVFDHIGIIVNNIDKATEILMDDHDLKIYGDKIIEPEINVIIQFLVDSKGLRYEIIEPNHPNSPLHKIIVNKNINKIHHIAYQVNNIDEKCEYFRQQGYGYLTKYFRAKIFDNARVIFLMSPIGFVIELIEKE